MVRTLTAARAESSARRAWLAAYLFYEQPWERFLVERIKPFIDLAARESWAKRFFFIRYWEGGPHIRLRFQGDPATLDGHLRPVLTKTFRSYFRANPSFRTRQRRREASAERYLLHRNNSIECAIYEPEVERYGGPTGMGIAERQFDASSRAVLSLLAQTPSWSYERRMGAGFQMHLAFAHSMGMATPVASRFFARVGSRWFGTTLGLRKGLQEDILAARRQATLRAFAASFQKSKRALGAHRKALWTALSRDRILEVEWLNGWVQEMRKVADDLRQAQRADLLTIPWNHLPGPRSAGEELWPILSSYVHMTNNRLGILNRDEAHLSYLLSRTLASR